MNINLFKFIKFYLFKSSKIKLFLKSFKNFLLHRKWALSVSSLLTKKNTVILRNKKNGEIMCFPYKDKFNTDSSQLKILSKGYAKFMLKKYELIEGEINTKTTIVDCGGFVGGFSIAALKNRNAKQSFYVEPTPLTRYCAALNFALYGIQNKVSIVKGGLGKKNDIKELNLSLSQTNNSFLRPDDAPTGKKESVKVFTFDYLLKKYNLDEKEIFFKLEAEGYEVEILKGMKSSRPKIISVDITPEMNGESPFDMVYEILIKKGYKLISKSNRTAFFKFKL